MFVNAVIVVCLIYMTSSAVKGDDAPSNQDNPSADLECGTYLTLRPVQNPAAAIQMKCDKCRTKPDIANAKDCTADDVPETYGGFGDVFCDYYVGKQGKDDEPYSSTACEFFLVLKDWKNRTIGSWYPKSGEKKWSGDESSFLFSDEKWATLLNPGVPDALCFVNFTAVIMDHDPKLHIFDDGDHDDIIANVTMLTDLRFVRGRVYGNERIRKGELEDPDCKDVWLSVEVEVQKQKECENKTCQFAHDIPYYFWLNMWNPYMFD